MNGKANIPGIAVNLRLFSSLRTAYLVLMARTPAGSPPDPRGAERFNEERASYTIKGSQPDIDAGVAAIREVQATLKPKPGVYRMLDARGDVLYVGKARALKNRVANYTQVDRLPLRLKRMVAQTRSMVIVTTNSEAEALLLEAQLIKRYRPPYNVLLRDDKSFPFILLRAEHDFPRIMKHRGARKAKGNYYGPFASAGSVNTTINALQKLFLLRSCTDSFFSRRDRPCLLYQIKRCSAPCVGRIDTAAETAATGLAIGAFNNIAGKHPKPFAVFDSHRAVITAVGKPGFHLFIRHPGVTLGFGEFFEVWF